jgi:hypothetical protein
VVVSELIVILNSSQFIEPDVICYGSCGDALGASATRLDLR